MANAVKFTDFSPNSPIWWNPDGTGTSKYFGGNDLKTGSWSFTMGVGQFILGAWDGYNNVVTSAVHAGLYFDNPDNVGSGTSVTSTWTTTINGEIASLNGTGLVFHNYLSKTANTLTVGADAQISGTYGGITEYAATNITNSGTITGQYAIQIIGFYDAETNGGKADDGVSDFSLNSNPTTLANGNVIYPGWKPDSNITSATKISITNKLGGEIIGVNVQGYPAGDEAVLGIDSDSYASVAVTNDGTISGGHTHLLYVNGYDENEGGWDGAAIYTRGALSLTNSSTGVIDGNIESDWVGTNITNSGEIDGTIIAYLSNTTTVLAPDPNDPNSTFRQYMEVLDPTGTILDANRNGLYDISKGDILLSKTPNIFTNSGIINGTYNYGYNNNDSFGDTSDDHYFRVAFDLGAQNNQITNTGTINGTIWFSRGNDTLTNSKAIYGHVDMGRGDDIVNNSGNILELVNHQIDGPTSGNTDYYSSGVWLGDGKNQLTNSGTIEGGVGAGNGKDTLTNNVNGFIYDGINLGSGGSTITNNAYISGGIYTGDDPNNSGQREADSDSVTNSATGVIYGGVDLGRGNNVVSNAGKIFGDIYTFDGNNTITNNGSLFGDINTGYGSDGGPGGHNTITNNKLISGDISTGDAGPATGSGKTLQQETITNNGTINGYICTGAGDRLIVNKGVVHDYIWTGMGSQYSFIAGTDTVTNSGDAYQVKFGTNNNTLNNSGLIRSGVFMNLASNDAEFINNAASGVINGGIHYGSGTNVLDNFGHISGDISCGTGQDIFTNEATGFISGAIFAGNGTNTFKNLGTDTGSYFGGSGVDAATNSKDIYWILTGAGADTVTNTGHVSGTVVLSGYGMDNNNNYTGVVQDGDGNNSLANSGTIDGKVYGGDHSDTITNSGRISGPLYLGGGSDWVDNTKGLALGDVYFGSGTNTFKGGATAEHVHFESGNDTDTMGAGNDTVFVDDLGALPNGNNTFIFDGGTGSDTLDLSHLTTAITNYVMSSPGALPANAANNLSLGGVNGSAYNFEKVIGTSLNDFITGTGNADTIDLGGGSNRVIGGGGADKLYAGAGHQVDTFQFNAISESGTTRSTRDVIYGFNDSTDKIALSQSGLGVGALTLDNPNTAFVSDPGHTHIHTIKSATQTIIEIDTDGNGKADMSIALDGIHTLTLSDFILV